MKWKDKNTKQKILKQPDILLRILNNKYEEKYENFTLIELLIVIAIIAITIRSSIIVNLINSPFKLKMRLT